MDASEVPDLLRGEFKKEEHIKKMRAKVGHVATLGRAAHRCLGSGV